MTKQVFQEWLVYLFKNYGMDPDESRIKFLTKLIGDNFGFKHDWEKVFTQIGLREHFFPSAAVIVRYLNVNYGVLTSREKAVALVDEILQTFLHYKGNTYEYLGKEKCTLAKKIGLDKFGLLSGTLDPRYLRRTWIDAAEREYSKESKEQSEQLNNTSEVKKLTEDLAEKTSMERK